MVDLSAPKSQRFLRLRCPSRTPEIARSPRQEEAMMHCDLRVRWKVASDLRFRAAISEPKTPSFCGISGDLAPSTWKSLAIAIVRFCCAKWLIAGKQLQVSGSVRARSRAQCQAVKVPSPAEKATASKPFHGESPCPSTSWSGSEYV